MDGFLTQGRWRNKSPTIKSIGRIGSNNATRLLRKNKDRLAQYFQGASDAVPWQYDDPAADDGLATDDGSAAEYGPTAHGNCCISPPKSVVGGEEYINMVQSEESSDDELDIIKTVMSMYRKKLRRTVPRLRNYVEEVMPRMLDSDFKSHFRTSRISTNDSKWTLELNKVLEFAIDVTMESNDTLSSDLPDLEIEMDTEKIPHMSDTLYGRRLSLFTTLEFYCDNCEKRSMITSDPTKNEINDGLVWGCLSFGIGHHQCEEIIGLINVPIMTAKTFGKDI
ncbi:hypothetical protein FQR65_LT16103 [Abscondita terminalis]|nr:hypothetical protein FQR65_LT16103 [Abscondita terminalis]